MSNLKVNNNESILSQRTTCMLCGWYGTVAEMEPDVDGDGGLGCPYCGTVIPVGSHSTHRLYFLRLLYWIKSMLGVK